MNTIALGIQLPVKVNLAVDTVTIVKLGLVGKIFNTPSRG
jgi:hypothetical protein